MLQLLLAIELMVLLAAAGIELAGVGVVGVVDGENCDGP